MSKRLAGAQNRYRVKEAAQGREEGRGVQAKANDPADTRDHRVRRKI